jgi:hypothetical protein
MRVHAQRGRAEIESADKEMEMKQMARRTLKAIADNYQRLVAERLA